VLELLAEHRALVEPQIALHLGVSEQAATSRLRALDAAGLIRRERIFEGLPATVSITRRGLDVIGSRLPAPRVDLKGHRHDVGAGWLWLAAHDGAFGPLASATSERSMRSSDLRPDREGRPFGVGLGLRGAGGGEQLHYPDLVLSLKDGWRVAIELELSSKSRRRLDRIMLGYACDGRYDTVLYLVPPGPIGRGIQDAARRAGIGDTVSVQLLAPGSPAGTVDPGRAVQRERSRGRQGRELPVER
jgi:hypothetical protein